MRSLFYLKQLVNWDQLTIFKLWWKKLKSTWRLNYLSWSQLPNCNKNGRGGINYLKSMSRRLNELWKTLARPRTSWRVRRKRPSHSLTVRIITRSNPGITWKTWLHRSSKCLCSTRFYKCKTKNLNKFRLKSSHVSTKWFQIKLNSHSSQTTFRE